MPNRKMIMNKETEECQMKTQNLIRTLIYIFYKFSGKPMITDLLKEQMTPKSNMNINTLYMRLNLSVFGPEFSEVHSYITAGKDKFILREMFPKRIHKFINDGGNLFYCQQHAKDEECKLKYLNGITDEFMRLIEQQKQKGKRRKIGRMNCTDELACNLFKQR